MRIMHPVSSARTSVPGRRAIWATALAAALLVTLVSVPGRGQTSGAAENAAVAGLEAKFVDVNGVRTRYYEYGEGEPMVLVHGGGRGTTSSANNWSPVIPLLASRAAKTPFRAASAVAHPFHIESSPTRV